MQYVKPLKLLKIAAAVAAVAFSISLANLVIRDDGFARQLLCKAASLRDDRTAEMALEKAGKQYRWSHREIEKLRDDIKAETARLQERKRDREITESVLISRCEMRDDCDPNNLDRDATVDSYWMATPMSLNYVERSIANAENEISTAKRSISEIRDNLDQPEQRIDLYAQMSENCQILLGDPRERPAQQTRY